MGADVKVDDAKWKAITRQVAQLAGRVAKVGLLKSAGVEPDGTSIVEIGFIHEFGTRSIPERSWLRSTFRDQRAQINTLIQRLAKGVVNGRIDSEQALGLLGTAGAAAVKRQITSQDIPPPLAESTIKAKGSSKPLVDTGRMINSISYAIGHEGDDE